MSEAPWPTPGMGEHEAAEAYRKVAIGRAARVEELMAEIAGLKENLRGVLRLIYPEHITPMGKRQIEKVLDEYPRITPPEDPDA